MKTNICKLLLLILIVCLPQFVSSQKYLFSKNYWHQGEITLRNGQVLKGLIKYHLDYNLVELKTGEEQLTKTFGSVQVANFSIFDTLTKVGRTFYALQSKTLSGYSPYLFFELIDSGDFEILTREDIVKKPHNKGLDLKGTGKYDLVLEDDFYFLDTDSKVRSCGKVQELVSLMDIPATDLKKYIKTNKIDLRQRTDFMTLINHFGIYAKKFAAKQSLGQ
ncbi:MAG: hypothetical protein EAZ08_10940 [Cytophagales bacterium]|nr:MAG: hypothetical protein EAZ08_10940 [Cytophagales bacterium]